MHSDAAEQANQRMVDRLIARGSLWSPRLIAAFRATPRHRFLDRVFLYHRKQQCWRRLTAKHLDEQRLRILYSDRALITRLWQSEEGASPVPISSSSQPSLMAQMLQDLRPRPGLRVLEIGAGTGYNAALLAHLVRAGQVVSVDVDRAVLAGAHDHLDFFTDRTVRLIHADGRHGYSAAAPYDRLMVTAATPDLEPAWLAQLAPRGVLLAPVVFAPGLSFVLRGTVVNGVLHGRLTRAAYFMPLRAEREPGSANVMTSPGGGTLHSLPAPWDGWFDGRRLRLSWFGFSQALAFYGFVRGLKVHYQTLADGQPGFGVASEDGICWFGERRWFVNQHGGQELGHDLWRRFLDAGGPWPTDFHLRAHPGEGLELDARRRESYRRRGPRCEQVWELGEPRERGLCFV